MTIFTTLTLHGWRAVIAGLFIFYAGCSLMAAFLAWLEDRITRDGWRLHRRWDHPGAWVILPDGRPGALQTVYRGEAAGDMAVVIFEDEDPEWHLVASLCPVPLQAVERELA